MHVNVALISRNHLDNNMNLSMSINVLVLLSSDPHARMMGCSELYLSLYCYFMSLSRRADQALIETMSSSHSIS